MATDLPKPELKFPVDWTFRIIIEEAKRDEILPLLQAILAHFRIDREIHPGDVSGKGTYRCYLVGVVLTDRPMMEGLAGELAAVKGVKMVL